MVEIQDYQIPKLPESIIDDSLVKASKRNVSSAVKGLCEAWKSLMGMPDIKWALPQPKEITSEWLQEEVERRCKGVKKLPNPYEEKQKIIASWHQIAEVAKPHVDTVIAFFESYPDADVAQTNQHELSVNNVDELVNRGITINIPPEAQEYFDHFCKMRRAIKEFRDFEEAHNYRTISLYDMLAKFSTPEVFAYTFAIGGMKVSDSKYFDNMSYKSLQVQCQHAEGRDYDY